MSPARCDLIVVSQAADFLGCDHRMLSAHVAPGFEIATEPCGNGATLRLVWKRLDAAAVALLRRPKGKGWESHAELKIRVGQFLALKPQWREVKLAELGKLLGVACVHLATAIPAGWERDDQRPDRLTWWVRSSAVKCVAPKLCDGEALITPPTKTQLLHVRETTAAYIATRPNATRLGKQIRLSEIAKAVDIPVGEFSWEYLPNGWQIQEKANGGSIWAVLVALGANTPFAIDDTVPTESFRERVTAINKFRRLNKCSEPPLPLYRSTTRAALALEAVSYLAQHISEIELSDLAEKLGGVSPGALGAAIPEGWKKESRPVPNKKGQFRIWWVRAAKTRPPIDDSVSRPAC